MELFYSWFCVSLGSAELQFAPGVLQQRLSAELSYLDAVEESVRQLSDVERVRGVSLAQQETVSLAQILKVKLCTCKSNYLSCCGHVAMYLRVNFNLCLAVPATEAWAWTVFAKDEGRARSTRNTTATGRKQTESCKGICTTLLIV